MIKNLEQINSIKRDKIQKGCEYVQKMNEKFPVIQKMVVFGSSITNECSQESDIDICLFTDYDASNPVFFQIYGNLPLVMDDICDILLFKKLTGKIKDEILEKGIVVYE